MFKIDLLKGQAVPLRCKPAGLAIIAIAFAVPLIALIVLIYSYLTTSATISAQQQEKIEYHEKVGELSEAVKLQKSFEKQKGFMNKCLLEVSSSVSRHFQWSPVLVTVVENMPDTMFLTKLEAKQNSTKRRVPQKNNPNILTDVSVPVRSLQMTMNGYPNSNCDRAVKDFSERLRTSALLKPILQDIRVSQKSNKLKNQQVIAYQIDCLFKPGL